MNTINGFSAAGLAPRVAAANSASGNEAASGVASKDSFKNLLIESLQQVNSMQANADSAVQQLLTGEDVNPAEVLTSLQKADLSFRMVMQIRNKLLAAYQEIKEVRI